MIEKSSHGNRGSPRAGAATTNGRGFVAVAIPNDRPRTRRQPDIRGYVTQGMGVVACWRPVERRRYRHGLWVETGLDFSHGEAVCNRRSENAT